jgi:hypothetical protein
MRRERCRESKAIEVPCGSTWRESSAKFNLATLSWKTHQCLWEEDLPSFSLTLPKWGMMQGGVLWERTTSPLPTSGIESGSWLTPTCMNIEPTENRREKRAKFRASIGRKDAPGGLAEQVATPKILANSNVSQRERMRWPQRKRTEIRRLYAI